MLHRKAIKLSALCALLAMSACRAPHPATAVQHHTDTVQLHHHHADTILRYESHIIRQKGDTIYIHDTLSLTHYRTQYRDSVKLINSTDTITLYRTTELRAKPTLLQRIAPHLLLPALVAGFALGLFLLRR